MTLPITSHETPLSLNPQRIAINQNSLQWKGHCYVVKTSGFKLWLTRLVSAAITLLGLALISASVLTAGIPLVIFGGVVLLYSLGMPIIREKFHENWYTTELGKKFKCHENFQNLSALNYTISKKLMRIIVRAEHTAGSNGLLRGINAQGKLIFLVSYKKRSESAEMNVLMLDRKNQGKSLIVDYEGLQIPLKKKTIAIPVFGNHFSNTLLSKIAD